MAQSRGLGPRPRATRVHARPTRGAAHTHTRRPTTKPARVRRQFSKKDPELRTKLPTVLTTAPTLGTYTQKPSGNAVFALGRSLGLPELAVAACDGAGGYTSHPKPPHAELASARALPAYLGCGCRDGRVGGDSGSAGHARPNHLAAPRGGHARISRSGELVRTRPRSAEWIGGRDDTRGAADLAGRVRWPVALVRGRIRP